MLQRTTTHLHDCSTISRNLLDMKNDFIQDVFVFVIRMWLSRIIMDGKWNRFVVCIRWRENFNPEWSYDNLLCCLIIWDTLTLCIHVKNGEKCLSYVTKAKIQNYIYFLLQMENCTNVLIVCWMFSFHCTVLWYVSLEKMLIEHVISVHDVTRCSSLSVECCFTLIKPFNMLCLC